MAVFDKSKSKGILFDSVRCIGCLSCEDSCDEVNGPQKRKWSAKEHKGFRKPPEGLSADKWLHMTAHPLPLEPNAARKQFNWDDAYELAEEGQYTYARHACMHCVEPTCVSVCPVGALETHGSGAVTYVKEKCMGCRYCMMACPFFIPKWEWHERYPYIRKCTMCQERQKQGEGPNCAENCPGNDDGPALVFGDRDELLFEAQSRIHEKRDVYYPHVFGKDEIGGTSVLYLMSKGLSPEAIDFPANLAPRSIPDRSSGPMSTVPYWALGLGAMFGGLYWIVQRRDQVMAEDSGGKREQKGTGQKK